MYLELNLHYIVLLLCNIMYIVVFVLKRHHKKDGRSEVSGKNKVTSFKFSFLRYNQDRNTPSCKPQLTFIGTGDPLQRSHIVVVLANGEGEHPHLD